MTAPITRRSPAGSWPLMVYNDMRFQAGNYIVYHGITDGSGPNRPIWNVEQAGGHSDRWNALHRPGGARKASSRSNRRAIADHVPRARPRPCDDLRAHDEYPQLAGDLRPAVSEFR